MVTRKFCTRKFALVPVCDDDSDADSSATQNGSEEDDDVDMRHENANDFEPDAAYGTRGGIANICMKLKRLCLWELTCQTQNQARLVNMATITG